MPPWFLELTKSANNDLAAIWIASSRRSDVNAAMEDIERSLTRGPRQEGQELSEGLWVIACTPLRALYEIDDVRQIVKIQSIKVSSI